MTAGPAWPGPLRVLVPFHGPRGREVAPEREGAGRGRSASGGARRRVGGRGGQGGRGGDALGDHGPGLDEPGDDAGVTGHGGGRLVSG